jgi:hypothetical protein
MRKVKFKKWIPREYTVGTLIPITGTGVSQSDFLTDGYFHQWGCAYEEFESGPGNYTIAIVEDMNGVIHDVLPTNLKFISE